MWVYKAVDSAIRQQLHLPSVFLYRQHEISGKSNPIKNN